MINEELLGRTKDNKDIYIYTLKSNYGSIKICSLGASIQSIMVPGLSGELVDVVLGFDNLSDIEEQKQFVGATIGRCANRISKGDLKINGIKYKLDINDGDNHLHGGLNGFHTINWQAEIVDDRLILYHLSEDGEGGYPGDLEVWVKFSFYDEGILTIEYKAVGNMDTIVNLTNHTYFNLSGHDSGDILDHFLMIDSDRYNSVDNECIPDGNVINVENSSMDFRFSKRIGEDIDADFQQIKIVSGYDHNYIFSSNRDFEKAVAKLYSPKTGICMEVFTDQNGMQFYSGNNIEDLPIGKDNVQYGRRSGLCLETQNWPDAVNHDEFPTIILPAGVEYHRITKYTFCLIRDYPIKQNPHI